MADNKVKFGLEKVHVAFFDEELGAFEKPQHIQECLAKKFIWRNLLMLQVPHK